jgi:hypothetical protein
MMAQMNSQTNRVYERKVRPAVRTVAEVVMHAWAMRSAYAPQAAAVYAHIRPTARAPLCAIEEEAPDVQEELTRLLDLAQVADEYTTMYPNREPATTEHYNALLAALGEIAEKAQALQERVTNTRAGLHLGAMAAKAGEALAIIQQNKA